MQFMVIRGHRFWQSKAGYDFVIRHTCTLHRFQVIAGYWSNFWLLIHLFGVKYYNYDYEIWHKETRYITLSQGF